MSAFLFALAWLILGVLVGLYAQDGHVDLDFIAQFMVAMSVGFIACAIWIRRRL